MRLLLDIGNSRLKWALAAGAPEAVHLHPHTGIIPAEAARQWASMAPPTEVWIASVAAPEMTRQCLEWCRSQWRLEPRLARTRRAEFGVVNAYPQPQRLGVDRWLGMIAAHRRHPGERVLVVDAGSAVTLDLLEAGGVHRGGLILPGLRAQTEALLRNTALPELAEAEPAGLWQQDTAAAVAAGPLQALVALIEKVAESQTRNQIMRLILTGGDAPRILPHLGRAAEHLPALVLEGLAMVAEGRP